MRGGAERVAKWYANSLTAFSFIIYRHIPGKITVNGYQLAINSDFAIQTIYLAHLLECSECYVATLMHHVMSENSNLPPTAILEQVLLEHHRRRRELVECLRFLFEAAEAAALSNPTPLLSRLDAFIQKYLLSSISSEGAQSGEKGLGWKVLLEIEDLEQTIVKAQRAKQNAGSNTVLQGERICSCCGVECELFIREQHQPRSRGPVGPRRVPQI